ncbi:MAG: type II toxin-antitoxin system PrlF family antitoxin [Verrucomicrobia bacterium]|jgi:bifunctional DNA-binding transcriptional regulator/antitoxin component of YhaV-PrlF toxin-antitoxin module|nr:type II toxin-antitoxin system PrlF family antitoxin [Verrucomicrobiota bacterium]OQC64606.1 MAG: putative regulator PrlF [Verrucomicrobia bacterium ADurb.Bin006]MDI9380207.1 type II toxin-antitoxin system PrlF family antitoxin [Verrucomicrobiota bacterium]NMD18831.1 AbrB family transcriptional regulator [Verrucomicrobiota bacterium]HOA62458.1 type II toxin-antitoxin system PrlF family antitoxin [Verrucomicrobiota bacterium]
MSISTLTDKGQTTVPQEIRQALGVAPRQRLVWEVRKDGSAIVRPVPSVMELAGSLKSDVTFSSIGAETEAATAAWASESINPKQR